MDGVWVVTGDPAVDCGGPIAGYGCVPEYVATW